MHTLLDRAVMGEPGYDTVHELDALDERRERVFLVLAGVFLGAMTMLNVIGITRFIQLGPLKLAIGVLPYPLAFLCTDFISEFYGRRRANFVVIVGLLLNLLVLETLWLGDVIPAVAAVDQPPWQTLSLSEPVRLPDGVTLEGEGELFHMIYACRAGSGVGLDGGVRRGPVLRRLFVSFLEAGYAGQAPVAAQQRIDHDQPTGGRDGGDFHHLRRSVAGWRADAEPTGGIDRGQLFVQGFRGGVGYDSVLHRGAIASALFADRSDVGFRVVHRHGSSDGLA